MGPANAQLMQTLTYGRVNGLNKLLQLYACSGALTSFCQDPQSRHSQQQENTTQNAVQRSNLATVADATVACIPPQPGYSFFQKTMTVFRV